MKRLWNRSRLTLAEILQMQFGQILIQIKWSLNLVFSQESAKTLDSGSKTQCLLCASEVLTKVTELTSPFSNWPPLFRSSLRFVCSNWNVNLGGRRPEGGEIPLHHLSSKRGLSTHSLVESILSSPGLLLFAGGVQGEGGGGREDLHLSVQWGGVHQEKVCASHTVETIDCSSSFPWNYIQRYNHRNFCIHMATSHGFDSVAQIMARWDCLVIKCEYMGDVLVSPCGVGDQTLDSKSAPYIHISHTQALTPWNEVSAPKFVPGAFFGERCSCSRTTSWWKPRWRSSKPLILVQTEKNHKIILRLKTIPLTRHRYLWNLTQVQLLLRNQWSWPPLVR